MRRGIILALLAVSACTQAGRPGPTAQAGGRPSEVRPAFDAAEVRRDLEASARARFGAALTDQALASPSYLLAKHYYGLPPPPTLQPDGSYRFPEPPTALLVRREGRWLAARPGGSFAPVSAEKAAALDAALADPRFASEPAHAPPGCTDAGASLLWFKPEARAALVRRGACGATQATERAIFAALEAQA